MYIYTYIYISTYTDIHIHAHTYKQVLPTVYYSCNLVISVITSLTNNMRFY